MVDALTETGGDELRDMLIAAIGCNIAWGFVDGVMVVWRSTVARGHKATLLRALHGARQPTPAAAIAMRQVCAHACGPLRGPRGVAHRGVMVLLGAAIEAVVIRLGG